VDKCDTIVAAALGGSYVLLMLQLRHTCTRHQRAFLDAATRGGCQNDKNLEAVRRKTLAWLSIRFPRMVLDHFNEESCLGCKLELCGMGQEEIERVVADLSKDICTRNDSAQNDIRYRNRMIGQVARWRFRVKTQTLMPSTECRALYGLEPDAPLAFSDYLDAVHPADRGMQRSALATAVERTGEYDVEHRVVWADGSVHLVRIMGSMTYQDDGTPFELVGASVLKD
jgi:hypothetical protein